MGVTHKHNGEEISDIIHHVIKSYKTISLSSTPLYSYTYMYIYKIGETKVQSHFSITYRSQKSKGSVRRVCLDPNILV